MKLSRELWIILVIQITEVLGFSLILPLLPFYAQDMGASPLVAASILSMFSLFQFVSAPLMGRLSDIYGRKPMLVLSQISTFLSFIILARAETLTMIFVSRMVDGLLGSNFTIAQAYISDVTSDKDRSKAFGISGMAFGIGFLIGPAIGGVLSRYGFSVPAYVAALVAFLTIIATLMFLPETVKRSKRRVDVKIIDWSVFTKYLKIDKVKVKLGVFLTYIMTHVIWTSNFALYGDRKWGFKPENVGWVFAYVGMVSVVFRGGLIGKLIDKFGESKLKRAGVLAVMIGLLGTMVVDKRGLIVMLTLFAFGSGVVRPLMMGDISRSVSKDEQGAVLGVANSLGSLAQVFGPLLGGYMLTKFFPESLMLTAFFMMGFGFLVIMGKRKFSKIKA